MTVTELTVTDMVCHRFDWHPIKVPSAWLKLDVFLQTVYIRAPN